MPTTVVEPWQPLLDALTALRSAWPAQADTGGLGEWSWDHRFKCLTSAVSAGTGPALRAILAPAVPSEWTPESLTAAPDHVRALRERCGDLRPGQLLFTRAPVDGMVLFAMWWPWGDVSKLSVRLGIANCTRSKELYPQMRSLFGIA